MSPQFTLEELLAIKAKFEGTTALHPGKSSWTGQKQLALIQKLEEMTTVIVIHYNNKYSCEACDEEWESNWCCACNDKCPTCNKECEPVESEELEQFKLKLKTEDCKVCGDPHDF